MAENLDTDPRTAPTTWYPCSPLAAALFPDRRVVEQKHPVGGVHQYLRNRGRALIRASLAAFRKTEASTPPSPAPSAKLDTEMKLASLTDPVFDGPTPPRGLQPSVALVTMTKNRPEAMKRLVRSVAGFVTKVIILDTGSTDENLHILETQLGFSPANIEVHSEPFVNFEVSRNRLMELAEGKAEWLLLLDDDMALKFTEAPTHILRKLNPSVGAYMLLHAGNLAYRVARLVRGDLIWRYKGVTHEYLVGGGVGNPHLDGLVVEHYYNHGPEKFNRDLRLLSADIARDPNDARTIFYLANTLRDLGQTAAAIRFFCMRANMGGWDEEVYNASYEAARLAKDPVAMVKVFGSRTTRAEAAAWLSAYYKFIDPKPEMHETWEKVRALIPFPKNDVLFVNKLAYGPEFATMMEGYVK